MIIEYYILNPTGNITALVVNNNYSQKEINYISNSIMRKHNNVEQIGFIDINADTPHLRMAGGEFCGNATMCTAYLYSINKNINKKEISVDVFGTNELFTVFINRNGNFCDSTILIPRPNSIEKKEFDIEGIKFDLPVVNMSGISHIITDKEFDYNSAKIFFEKYIDILTVPAMGIMILDSQNNLKPIVYVKDCDTLFFENSCASGSCAVGTYLTANDDTSKKIDLFEPGGIIKVESSKNSEFVKLYGKIQIDGHYTEEI